MGDTPDERNKFQANTTEPYAPGISKTSNILDRLCKLSISDLAEARREVSQAATELDYREFVKALSCIPADAFGLFDPQNGYSTDILVKRDDCRDAVNVCSVLVFLMTTDGLDPRIADRFSQLHNRAVRDKHCKSGEYITFDHHTQAAVPGYPGLEVDSECANLIGYLNATGSRTYWSCQGEEHEKEREQVLTHVTVERYGDADTTADHSKLILIVANPLDGDSFSSLLHDTMLPGIVAERNLRLRRDHLGDAGAGRNGYIMFDFSDDGEAMRRAMSALVERAKITDPQFVCMLRGDYLDHLAKQVQSNDHEFHIYTVGAKTCATFRQYEPVADDDVVVERFDEVAGKLVVNDVVLHMARERRWGRRSTVRLPKAYIRLLDRAAGELLLELPIKSKMGTSNTVTAGDAMVHGAPLTSITCGPFFGQATGKANLREELARTSPEATLHPSRNKNDAGVKYPYLHIDIPKNENPQSVWSTLRDAAIRVGVIDPVVLEFLQGDEPFWQAFTGSGHLVEVEYELRSGPYAGAISRQWQRDTRVEQSYMAGIVPNVDRPDRITISIYAKDLVEALLDPSAPADTLTTPASKQTIYVRSDIASNPSTPKEVLTKLANDADIYVRWAVALNPSTPKEVLTKLANDADDYVRRLVAQNLSTPKEVLAKLANDGTKGVGRAVALNPSTPKEVLTKLANDADSEVRRAVAGNPSIPKEVLAKLANDESFFVRWYVAENPSTTKEILTKLANDADDYVRRLVAKNPLTPKEVFAKLANDEDDYVRSDVAKNPSTPGEALDTLANDESYSVREAVARNPSAPASVLRTLSGDKDETVRYYIAGYSRTPVGVLTTLANDQDAEVRSAVARNPSAPASVLRTLSGDKDENIRRHVARNPLTPANVLTILANDQTTYVRRAAALNSSTPVDALRTLSGDEYWAVRVGVSENPSAPVDALRKLANEQYPDVRAYVAGNLSTSIDVLTMLANDQTAKVRSAVARNPSAPADILTTLANDQDEDVRNAIALNTSTIT